MIAHNETEEDILHRIGADSLGYLSVDGMLQVIAQHKEQWKREKEPEIEPVGEKVGGGCQKENGGYCSACFSGNYPVDIEDFVIQPPLYEQRKEKERQEREKEKEKELEAEKLRKEEPRKEVEGVKTQEKPSEEQKGGVVV